MFRFSKRTIFYIGKISFFLGMGLLFIMALGFVVLFLWNAILPDAIGAKPLTYWKAVGLLALTRILFGSFRFGPRRHRGSMGRKHWREKWMNMSEEEKAELKKKWKERCSRR